MMRLDYPPELRRRDLTLALRSALRDEYADASEQEMQEALTDVLDAMSPAEAFNFGSALNRIAKSANQVLADPTFQSVAATALPIAGGLAGTFVGGPAGAALGSSLGNLAAGALAARAAPPRPAAPPAPPAPAAPRIPAASPAPPAASPAPPAVAGGSAAAAQSLVLTQQPDVLRSLLATALGSVGRKDVSGIPNAQLLAQVSRLFGQAAADADELAYLEGAGDTAEGVPEAAPPGALYADLLGADNIELAEAVEGDGLY
jgi:hypothetical protein